MTLPQVLVHPSVRRVSLRGGREGTLIARRRRERQRGEFRREQMEGWNKEFVMEGQTLIQEPRAEEGGAEVKLLQLIQRNPSWLLQMSLL